MMFEYADDGGRYVSPPRDSWSSNAQYMYSVLWSAFLDLDAYTASRALQRFRPYSSEWVARELLGLNTDSETRERGRRLRLTSSFDALATWLVAPRLLSESAESRRDGGRPWRSTSLAEADRVNLRKHFERHFSVPVAYRRWDVDAQSPLPPLPDLGIGPATIDVVAGRGTATATLRSAVQVPYGSLCQIVQPAVWGESEHFVIVGGGEERSGSCDFKLRLPGGAWVGERKQREMKLQYDTFTGAFESRVDYAASELDAPPDLVADSGKEFLPSKEEENKDEAGRYSKDAVHVGAMRGFLSVEKMKGCPGWSSVVAERTIAFESQNHDRFKVETLMFWHAIELMSFVLARRPEAKVQA
jgi:hypothetical protein